MRLFLKGGGLAVVVVVLAAALQAAVLQAAVPSKRAGSKRPHEGLRPGSSAPAAEVDKLLAGENDGLTAPVAPTIDDLAFLRRVTVDLVGRIPTQEEIQAYLELPADTRRMAVVDRLLEDDRFADRWTVFFADMLRVRYYADGGAQLAAFVHQSIEDRLPYDEMCRRLLAANGKAGSTPEVGFVLGDNADPLALAGVASQVFLGIRIACAQCHDHPFDVWKREQFYGLAAYFGKTQRIESQLTRAVYTTEMEQSAVLWPPEDEAEASERKPMQPAFPFELESPAEAAPHVERLVALRKAQAEHAARQAAASEEASVDDLFDAATATAEEAADGTLAEVLDVAGEAKREAAALKVHDDLYRASQWRRELAEFITNPRNQYFSRAFVNRVWAELLGRGFVEPIDDFSASNAPSHPETLDYLADEFVAGGYDLRSLVRMIVGTQAYQRGCLADVDEATRAAAEAAFASAPLRRMVSEALFDSIVQAGHLFDFKHPAGANLRVVRNLVRMPAEGSVKPETIGKIDDSAPGEAMAMRAAMAAQAGGYDLEAAIEVDFDSVLKASAEQLELDKMAIVSNEELEAAEMTEPGAARMRYVERWVETEVDDNPRFASAMRMASPADPAHFLRVFGQPSRDLLGEHRDDSASMRQALMMLNGKLTHEASRVGDFEPIHKLLIGKKANLNKAIRLAYQEILTREPLADELAEARQMIREAESPREGMADLRWLLFNCHEFRFLP